MNPLFAVLLILLAAVLAAAAVMLVIAAKNIASMNRCMDTVLTELRRQYTLTPLDPGEYKQLFQFSPPVSCPLTRCTEKRLRACFFGRNQV